MYPPLRRPPVTPRTPAPTRSKLMNPNAGTSESLQVFCRLRPTEDVSCIQVISDTTIRLTLPKSSINFRPGACKEYQYSFKKVFTEANTQKELFNVVARPLVENLIQGKDGLLFTYGVTGSGKTHTMTGHENSAGILPRCLDVLFNTIDDYQAKKYVFKPDLMNGFEVQSEADALKEQEEALRRTYPRNKRLKKNQSNENLTDARSKDESRLSIVEEDNAYSVFVTYIEIYNNIVYDLLESTNENDMSSKLQTKLLREDGTRNMYVLGVTEVEVKSANEAYEVFCKGQKRRRVEPTNLNKESSRSHSIFTIRLVQAPLDAAGENVLDDKKVITISQLSLVDLAGSERTNRTNNCGQRLREAGNINNSLMNLRKCLEILREKQRTGIDQKIPHREQRLTHLFKKFFDGEGDIRMIVCASPGVADYDETIQVLKFAEVSQEILVKPTPARPEVLRAGLTPGRRRDHQKRLVLEEVEPEPRSYVPNDVGAIYSLEPFPHAEDFDPLDPEANNKLMKFLENRIQKKKTLMTDFEDRCAKFRANLLEREENTLHLQQEYNALNALHERDLMKTRTLEEKVLSLDAHSSNMKRRYEHFEDDIKSLKRQIEEKDMIIAQLSNEKDRHKRVHKKMAAKVDLLSKEKENEFREKQQIHLRMVDTDKRLLRVKNALAPHDENLPVPTPRKVAKYNELNVESEPVSSSIPEPEEWISVETTTSAVSPTKSIAVSNVRYGRTHNGPNDEWLDHRAGISAPLNTVMQPVMKRRRSFSNATSPKEINKTSKYCLMTQDQVGDGTLETQLYKGDVIRTCGGGAQIILNDVETLRQTSPVSSPVTSPVTSPRRIVRLKSPSSNSATAAIAASSSSAKYPDISSVEGGSYWKK